MDQKKYQSPYELYQQCRAMREMNSIRFTSEIIVGRSLLNIDETMSDSKDSYILSFMNDITCQTGTTSSDKPL